MVVDGLPERFPESKNVRLSGIISEALRTQARSKRLIPYFWRASFLRRAGARRLKQVTGHSRKDQFPEVE